MITRQPAVQFLAENIRPDGRRSPPGDALGRDRRDGAGQQVPALRDSVNDEIRKERLRGLGIDFKLNHSEADSPNDPADEVARDADLCKLQRLE